MDTSINSFFGRIHPQGVGRRVPRYCVASLSLAASRARSLHAYLSDMLRRSLRGFCGARATRLGTALWCGSAEQQACPPSLKSEFLEMPK